MKKAAIYIRVSTDGQTTENQRRALVAVAKRAKWKIVEVYEDKGVSGAKARDQRPAFKRMTEAMTRREFDVVMAWSVDRLGRSLQDLLGFLGELHALGIDLYLDKQGMDTTTPAGRALFQMLGVFAEFERAMIQDRVKAGLDRARKEGKVLGRPVTEEKKKASVRALASQGMAMRAIAEKEGLGVGTVHRILASA